MLLPPPPRYRLTSVPPLSAAPSFPALRDAYGRPAPPVAPQAAALCPGSTGPSVLANSLVGSLRWPARQVKPVGRALPPWHCDPTSGHLPHSASPFYPCNGDGRTLSHFSTDPLSRSAQATIPNDDAKMLR